MKILLQRVKEASVTVEKKIISKIDRGFLVFIGIHVNDREEDIDWYINKILNLRVFEDDNQKMNLSIEEIEGELLIVSQFTLYANCFNGRRPDFIDAMKGENAEALYEMFLLKIKNKFNRVKSGVFGAMMEISLINDGPATFIIEKKSQDN